MDKLIFICVLVFALGFVTGNAFSQTTTTAFVTTTTAPVTTTIPVTEQDFCQGDFNYNGSVAAEDVTTFLEHFGRSQFNNPCPPDGPAPVSQTGQTTSYATGDDGDLGKGAAWPNPRFTNNLDGTITDNLTGLIWLKDANCFDWKPWDEALSDCNGLADGQCGLTDGSNTGDWRLPSRFELESLLTLEYFSPAVPNTVGTGQWSQGDPFNNLYSSGYWSATTKESDTSYAWVVGMNDGVVGYGSKSVTAHIWPVRGGH